MQWKLELALVTRVLEGVWCLLRINELLNFPRLLRFSFLRLLRFQRRGSIRLAQSARLLFLLGHLLGCERRLRLGDLRVDLGLGVERRKTSGVSTSWRQHLLCALCCHWDLRSQYTHTRSAWSRTKALSDRGREP